MIELELVTNAQKEVPKVEKNEVRLLLKGGQVEGTNSHLCGTKKIRTRK